MRRADEPTSRDGGRDGTHGTKGTDGTGEDVGAGGLLWAGGGRSVGGENAGCQGFFICWQRRAIKSSV